MAFSDFKTSFQNILTKIKDKLNTLNSRVTDIETWQSSVGSGLTSIYVFTNVFGGNNDDVDLHLTTIPGWDNTRDIYKIVVHTLSTYTSAQGGNPIYRNDWIKVEYLPTHNKITLTQDTPPYKAPTQDPISSTITLYYPNW